MISWCLKDTKTNRKYLKAKALSYKLLLPKTHMLSSFFLLMHSLYILLILNNKNENILYKNTTHVLINLCYIYCHMKLSVKSVYLMGKRSKKCIN